MIEDVTNLAQGLRAATALAARIEARLADFLMLTVPTWRARFPHGLGWTWADPSLEIWDVEGADSPGLQDMMDRAAQALFVRGFSLVILHWHGRHQHLACQCTQRSCV